MGSEFGHQHAVRYKGFLLIPQMNQSWLVRPERSPMRLLPFRQVNCSLEDLKVIIDCKLNEIKKDLISLDQAA